MAWTDYFKEVRRDRRGIYLEFTDEEIAKYNRHRNFFILWIILAAVFSWTVIGLFVFGLLALHQYLKMVNFYEKIKRRYLKRRQKK